MATMVSPQIRSLQINALRGIDDLGVDFVPCDEDRGQWIVLLGENGCGKSTILRAIALALSEPQVTTSLVTQTSAQAPYVRRGEMHALAEVELDGEGVRSVTIRAGSSEQAFVESATTPHPVFAYGSLRGGALGGAKREVRLDPYSGVATLFDTAASLVHADTWLRDVAYASTLPTASPEDQQFFRAVHDTLVSLLPGVETIAVERDRTYVSGTRFDRVPLAGMSDGYLTTLGWTVDLLARWSSARRGSGGALGAAFATEMRCVVLIDELDLHLHPRWQTEVISRLRTAFPRTTFVVTTHNPLTLHGTQPGEVHVMRRLDDGGVEVVQRDLPPGITAEQVLTGEWFGLTTTLDPDTKAKLDRHTQLLREQAHEGNPERVALEAALRGRLGRFAETSVERLAQQVVADVLDTGKPITNADRARVKATLEARLRGPGGGGGASRAKEPGAPKLTSALKPKPKRAANPKRATKAKRAAKPRPAAKAKPRAKATAKKAPARAATKARKPRRKS